MPDVQAIMRGGFAMAVIMLIIFGVLALAGDQPLETPTGEIALTVEGNIGRTNVGDTARFDRAMLDSLPQATIRTKGPLWFEGESSFTGPTLSAVLTVVNAQGTMLKARAANGYTVTIPATDGERWGVILATRQNGKDLTDKGPIWLIYPWNKADLQNDAAYAKGVWQLVSILVE